MAVTYLLLAAFGLRYAPIWRCGLFACVSVVLLVCAVRWNEEPWAAFVMAVWHSSIGASLLTIAVAVRAWVQWHRSPNLPLLMAVAAYLIASLSMWPRAQRPPRKNPTSSLHMR